MKQFDQQIRIYYKDANEVESMKKFFVFAATFIILFILFQMLAGMLITLAYTPDFSGAWAQASNLPAKTTILSGQGSFIFTVLLALLAASIAYFLSNKMSSKA